MIGQSKNWLVLDRGLPLALAKGGNSSIPPFEPHAAPAQLLILTLISASANAANGLLSSQLAVRPDLPTRQLHSVRATERGRAGRPLCWQGLASVVHS
ncbi:unknown protein [Desulfotalea psychrophila LSv54]|uniref:Uncharacterized protein n=1 Tax=Desulfotalea psychrophila (strain LSv54 / DSM 12343) TaxID=177439 RepID=Q6AKQ2_DESPS|nr:unknown protein [Desulfotalea psychrophila LSv54]